MGLRRPNAASPDLKVPVHPSQTRVALDSLTSLRFIAAALVLAHHGAVFFMPGSPLQRVTNVGYVGVEFFFILSGFVLMWSFSPDLPVRTFYGRRIARIYPLYIVTTILAVPVLLLVGRSIGLWETITAVFGVQAWIPMTSFGEALNPVSWTISCELFFYAIFPFVARLVPRLRLRLTAAVILIVMVIVVILVITLTPIETAKALLYKGPWFRVGGFLLGVLLAQAMRAGYRPRFGLRLAFVVFVLSYAIAMFAGPIAVHLGIPNVRAWADLVMIPAVCMLITTAATSDLASTRTWLTAPQLVRLGQASFALYLTHYLIMMVVWHVVGDSLPPLQAVTVLVVTAVACIALSVPVFQRFERPLERSLRRRIGSPRQQTANPPAAGVVPSR